MSNQNPTGAPGRASVFNQATGQTLVISPAKPAGAAIITVASRKGRDVLTVPLSPAERLELIAALQAAGA